VPHGQAVPRQIPEPVGERHPRRIPQDVKIAVSARDAGRCRQCGCTEKLHFDHIIPVSRGGANTVANIQLLCGPCNRAKAAKYRPAG
jgi:5-methylcytosine-specific restriction endonuclease McrA